MLMSFLRQIFVKKGTPKAVRPSRVSINRISAVLIDWQRHEKPPNPPQESGGSFCMCVYLCDWPTLPRRLPAVHVEMLLISCLREAPRLVFGL